MKSRLGENKGRPIRLHIPDITIFRGAATGPEPAEVEIGLREGCEGTDALGEEEMTFASDPTDEDLNNTSCPNKG